MRPGVRVAAFAAAVGVAAGAAALAGGAIDPLRDGQDPGAHADAAHGGHGAAVAAPAAASGHGHGPGGLAVAEDGYVLAPDRTALPLGRATRLSFRILGPGGEAVHDFDVEHERAMHLIVVRRDMTGYQHLHPRLDATGRWSVPLRLPDAGVYRAYADFTSGGRSFTLATDLFAGGSFRPAPLAPPATRDRVDEYEAELQAHGLSAGETAEVSYAVSRDGAPVADIEPYLGADGHLVVLREGDMAFLHVHPEDDGGRSGGIRFGATFPSAGRYRLFLQFKHDGAVRTVAHTVVIPR